MKTYLDENGEKIDYGFGAVSKETESPYPPLMLEDIGALVNRFVLYCALSMLYSDASTQFAYLQLGTIISIIIRQVELRIDEIPAHNYSVSIVLHPKSRPFVDGMLDDDHDAQGTAYDRRPSQELIAECMSITTRSSIVR